VAKALGIPFIDTDKRIVAEHGPIAEIFETWGEPHFRSIERDTVAEALGEDAVVALGGGAVLDEATQELLRTERVVQLTVSPEAVSERIADGKRPLLKDGIGAWLALVDARAPIYDRLAQFTVDTSNRPLTGVANEITAWLRRVDSDE
jgi:shikimate kinase